ncbi:MAG TPA: IclR family transcriptional regulator [Ramlibacter sp.]|nr:IclR family transcriptional regulator [Ramlibacter sp.]
MARAVPSVTIGAAPLRKALFDINRPEDSPMPPKKPTEDTAAAPERDASGPRSLTRLLGLFGVLSQAANGMTLAELSVALESPKSSLLNLLRPLVSEGYLIHGAGVYKLGPSIYRLSASVMSAWNFPNIIRPFMEELSARTEETVLLGVMNNEAEALTYVEIIDSPHPVRYQIPVGTTRPLYASSAGRLLLAFSDKKWLDNYLASVVFKAKTAIPISRGALRQELDKIRAEGVSWSIDGYLKGLSAVAGPVFDASGRCVASLNIAGPSERFRSELDFLKLTVKEVTKKASGVVGSIGGASKKAVNG